MYIFDGNAFAQSQEPELAARVEELRSRGETVSIAAVLFTEDSGSQLYTRFKREAAERVGITYQVHECSLHDSLDEIQAIITALNADPAVNGIIIQKPWRKTWVAAQEQSFVDADAARSAFAQWWQRLVEEIAVEKDVDGLHPSTLAAIREGTWRHQGRVLPATAQAVVTILQYAAAQAGAPAYDHWIADKRVAVIGRSDIVGLPLTYELQNQKVAVENLGRADVQARQADGRMLLDFDIVVSSTGVTHVITGEMVSPGVVLIDVGEPRPDINQSSVQDKASFLTPVPGGVGPVTVVSLLRNGITLASN